MDKKRLKDLAGSKRFLEGIYNYCDRWCERCPFTSRCLNYAMAEDEPEHGATRDVRNQAFWQKVEETLQFTLELLHEFAEGFQKDSDGSAKVALIGIDRSLAAWGEVRRSLPLFEQETMRLLLHLERLPREVEKAFPAAPAFIGPGFDRVDLHS
jgi:hypothetical protein